MLKITKQEELTLDLEEQKIDEIPTEEDIKSAKTPDDKLEMMKKLLANSKVAENVKQKKIYSAMTNIVVVRNY